MYINGRNNKGNVTFYKGNFLEFPGDLIQQLKKL